MTDEAPIDRTTTALQEAMRQMLAEAGTVAAMQAAIGEMRGDLDRLKERVEAHLSDAAKDRDAFDTARDELRAALARLEADLRRFADAQAALAALEKARSDRDLADAAKAEARWKERGAMLATAAGVVALIAKEVVSWVRQP